MGDLPSWVGVCFHHVSFDDACVLCGRVKNPVQSLTEQVASLTVERDYHKKMHGECVVNAAKAWAERDRYRVALERAHDSWDECGCEYRSGLPGENKVFVATTLCPLALALANPCEGGLATGGAISSEDAPIVREGTSACAAEVDDALTGTEPGEGTDVPPPSH